MDENTTEAAFDVLTVVGYAGLGLAAGLAVSILITIIVKIIARRRRGLLLLARHARLPQRILLSVFGAGVGVLVGTSEVFASAVPSWRGIFLHGFLIAMIILGANLLQGIITGTEAMVMDRFKDGEESAHARRVRTQMQVMRRVGVAVVWLCAIAGVFLTFPTFQALGATLFASAGVASLVLGFAAQSSLGNLFAGIQIAFTDAVRVGDRVVVEGQMGSVEELTLTYVVVRTWDDRRLIMPSTFFTSSTFENWTRREADLLGTVEFDLDFLAPVKAMRVELQRIVESSELWDRRTVNLQVTDAVDGKVRIRVVVSAESSGTLWDLRCLIREQLVEWVHRNAPYALPRTRLEPEPTSAPSIEERDNFIDEVQEEWEKRRRESERLTTTVDTLDELKATEPVPAPPRNAAAARRARKVAAKRDRQAAKRNPRILAGHDAVRPLPSSEATRVLSREELEALRIANAADNAGISSEETGLRDGREPLAERDASEEARHGGRNDTRGAGSAPDASSAATPEDPRARPGRGRPTTARTTSQVARTSVINRAPSRQEPDPGEPTSAAGLLYSGSPEAEERAMRLAGPSKEEMAEREDAARRRNAGLPSLTPTEHESTESTTPEEETDDEH